MKCHKQREQMWEKYHKYWSSDEFMQSWSSFIEENTGFCASPILYQYVTNVIMESLIQKHFPINIPIRMGSDTLTECTLPDYEERNAIRYSAGYVIQSLIKKLMKSAHVLKDELILCLQEMIEGKYNNVVQCLMQNYCF